MAQFEERKMKSNTPLMWLGYSLIFTLSGCYQGQDYAEIDASPKSVNEKEPSIPMEDEAHIPQSGELKHQVNEAIADLAGRLNVLPSEISTIRAENVVWRDGSRGCPQEGVFSTQALVPGSLIVLRVGDTEYEYHSGGSRDPFYCVNPEPPATALTAE
jgi:hypothetical protein